MFFRNFTRKLLVPNFTEIKKLGNFEKGLDK